MLGQEPAAEEVARVLQLEAELAQPGPEHEMLARMVGTWDQELSIRTEPGAEPIVAEVVAKAHLILGGRFLTIDTHVPGLEESVGLSILGFDRRSGEYTTLGFDTTGTYWASASGTAPQPGQPLVMSGEDYNPQIDHLKTYDFVMRWIDDDTYTWSVIFKDQINTRGGGPFEMVVVTSRRR